MPTRRTVLSGVVESAISAPLVGVGAAAPRRGADSNAQSKTGAERTELVVTGDPNIYATIGVPDGVAPQFRALRGRYESVSLSDIGSVTGTLRTSGAHIESWSGTAMGSFDVRSIGEELEEETAFRREDRTDRAGGNQSSQETATEGTTAREGRESDDSSPQVFVRPEPATVVAVESDRIDIARGTTREGARDRLADRRNETGPAATDVARYGAASVSLGESTRKQLVTRLPDAAERLRTVVGELRAAGMAVQAAPETTTVRYAISLREGHRAGDALTELKTDLVAHESTRLIEERRSETSVVVDVSIQTDAVWSVHRDTVGAE